MKIIEQIKEEYREDPFGVLTLFALMGIFCMVALLWPSNKNYWFDMAGAFFVLILYGVQSLEKRLERIEAQIKISNMLETEVRNLKKHQLKVEGKL